MQTFLGYRNKTRQNALPRELSSDVEIQSSLSYAMNEPPFTQRLLSILISVDAYNILRVYLQYPDQSELLFKFQIQFTNKLDYSTSVEFYLRAKCIIVSSKFGQNIVITSHLKQFDIFGPRFKGMCVSKVLHFDYKNSEYLAIGLTNGNCIIKRADKLMNESIEDTIFSINYKGTSLFNPFVNSVSDINASYSRDRRRSSVFKGIHNRSGSDIENSNDQSDDKVTFIGYFTQPNRIIIGSKEGCITFYTLTGKEPVRGSVEQFSMGEENRTGMSRIVQVMELPSKIQDVKKHVYYILTNGNLYAMSKEEKKLEMQRFYKGDKSAFNRPRLL